MSSYQTAIIYKDKIIIDSIATRYLNRPNEGVPNLKAFLLLTNVDIMICV